MFFKSLSYKNEQILENFLPDEAYLPLDCSSFYLAVNYLISQWMGEDMVGSQEVRDAARVEIPHGVSRGSVCGSGAQREHPPHLPPDLTIHYRHTICQSPILHIDSAIY